jgi:hypothetical protein
MRCQKILLIYLQDSLNDEYLDPLDIKHRLDKLNAKYLITERYCENQHVNVYTCFVTFETNTSIPQGYETTLFNIGICFHPYLVDVTKRTSHESQVYVLTQGQVIIETEEKSDIDNSNTHDQRQPSGSAVRTSSQSGKQKNRISKRPSGKSTR